MPHCKHVLLYSPESQPQCDIQSCTPGSGTIQTIAGFPDIRNVLDNLWAEYHSLVRYIATSDSEVILLSMFLYYTCVWMIGTEKLM